MFLNLITALTVGFLFVNRVNNLILILGMAFILAFGIFYNRHDHFSIINIVEISNRSKFIYVSPILKLVFTVAVIFLIVGSQSIYLAFLGLIFSIFILFYDNLKFSYIKKLLTAPFLVILISTIGIVLIISRENYGYFDLGILSVTRETQDRALKLILISLSSVMVMISLAITTPIGDIIFALKKLKVPQIIIELMYLIYRYVFLLFYTLNSIQHSAESRFGFINFKNTYRSFKYISSKLFNRSIRMSLDSYSAMESRMYDGNLEFLERKYNNISDSYIYYISLFIFIVFYIMSRFVWKI